MSLPGYCEIGGEKLSGKFVAGEDLTFDGGKNNQARSRLRPFDFAQGYGGQGQQ